MIRFQQLQPQTKTPSTKTIGPAVVVCLHCLKGYWASKMIQNRHSLQFTHQFSSKFNPKTVPQLYTDSVFSVGCRAASLFYKDLYNHCGDCTFACLAYPKKTNRTSDQTYANQKNAISEVFYYIIPGLGWGRRRLQEGRMVHVRELTLSVHSKLTKSWLIRRKTIWYGENFDCTKFIFVSNTAEKKSSPYYF